MSGAQFASREHPLIVGHAEDPAEREADRMADAVIARLQPGPSEHDTDAQVRRSASMPDAAPEVGIEGGRLSADLSQQITAQRGRGAPLAADVRERMEGAFGTSLASVRVHTGPAAGTLNRRVSARAFTTGQDIFFGAGEYQPDTQEGERTLAHEIAHTRQHGNAVSRISRLWDLKGKRLPLGSAKEVTTLDTHPIWFVEDNDGDRIVVKADDQAVGLSSLAGALHKNIAGVKSVKERKLDRNERLGMDNLLEIRSFFGMDPSWRVRGDYIKGHDAQADQNADSEELAKDDALARVNDKNKNLVAMSVAEGEQASKLAAPDASKGAMADDRSQLRRIFSNYQHVKLLGQVMAVDMFLGNLDRVYSGNLGNWFYNPAGEMTLIDHLDPGSTGPDSSTTALITTKAANWAMDFGNNYLKKNLVNGDTPRDAAVTLLKAADAWGQDTDIRNWGRQQATTQPQGVTNQQVIEHALHEGLVEGLQRIVQVFSSTKWKLTQRGAHKAKKNIRAAARAAAATDSDGGQQFDYYDELRRRAAWIKTNSL